MAYMSSSFFLKSTVLRSSENKAVPSHRKHTNMQDDLSDDGSKTKGEKRDL